MAKPRLATLAAKMTVGEFLSDPFVLAAYESRSKRAYYLDRRLHRLFRTSASHSPDISLTVGQFVGKHPEGFAHAGEKSRQWFAQYLSMFDIGNGVTPEPLSPEANAVLEALKKP